MADFMSEKKKLKVLCVCAFVHMLLFLNIQKERRTKPQKIWASDSEIYNFNNNLTATKKIISFEENLQY